VPQATEERELIRAQARYVHSSARKARLVLEHIRGKSAVEAQSILAFQTRAVARDAGKVLRSAIANAENNNGHDAEDLVVVTAWADEGPTLKRWRARARGRVNRIRKRTCHITITVSPAIPGEIKPRPERRTRPEVETAPAVAEPAKPKRSRKKAAPAAPDAAAAVEPETAAEPEAAAEPSAEPEAVVEPEAAAEPSAEPETAVEPEAAAEPDPEPAVEPEAVVEPEPEAAAEPEPADEPEPAADETSPDSVENEKEADS
jgi:large subunit ribosomal protein L22